MKFFLNNSEITAEKVSGSLASAMGLIYSVNLPSGEKVFWYSGGHAYPSIKGFYKAGVRSIKEEKEAREFKINSDFGLRCEK